MKRLGFVVAALVAGFLALVGNARAAEGVSISVDRTEISTQLGLKFRFTSTVTNGGAAPTESLIAHLNVLSLFDGVYVDPEDWSSERTVYLGALAPGQSWTHTWDMQAVNAGTFGVYVAVFPQNATGVQPTTGPTVEVHVASRRTINPGGILPLAFGVPAFVALLGGGVRWSRRRRR